MPYPPSIRPSFPPRRNNVKPRDPADEKAREAEIKEFIAKRGVTKIDSPEYKPLPRHIPWTPEPKIDDLRLLAKISTNPKPEQAELKESEPESQSPPTPPPPKKRGRPPKSQPTPIAATTPTPEPKRAGRPPASVARVHFGRMGLKLQIDYQDCGVYTEGPWKSNDTKLNVTSLNNSGVICHIDRRGRHRADPVTEEETAANLDLISAAPDYDAVTLAFLEKYQEIDDEVLHRIMAGEKPDYFTRAPLDSHIAKALLGYRFALAKARGAAEKRQVVTRRCNVCKEVKPHYEFSRRHGRCNQCRRVKTTAGKERSRENLVQYNRRWRIDTGMMAPSFYKVRDAIQALISEDHTRITQTMVMERSGVTADRVHLYWRHPEIIQIGGDRLYRPEDRAELMKTAIKELLSEGIRPTQHKVADRLGITRGAISRHWKKAGTTIELMKMAIMQLFEAKEPVTQIAVSRITKLDHKNTIPRNWHNPQIVKLLKRKPKKLGRPPKPKKRERKSRPKIQTEAADD